MSIDKQIHRCRESHPSATDVVIFRWQDTRQAKHAHLCMQTAALICRTKMQAATRLQAAWILTAATLARIAACLTARPRARLCTYSCPLKLAWIARDAPLWVKGSVSLDTLEREPSDLSCLIPPMASNAIACCVSRSGKRGWQAFILLYNQLV